MAGLIQQLNIAYFWDVDISKLHEVKSKRLIIERVFNFGSIAEMKLIKDYYGEKIIASTLCDLSYIDPKTLNFLALLFHLPKSKFKCYTRTLLTHQPWTY